MTDDLGADEVTTSDGVTLEAELRVPEDTWAGAVLCHPHPQYGGDMHAPLIDAMSERLLSVGVTALRFNFRGVGRSGGAFDGGRGEHLDVAAALDRLVAATPEVPLVLAGWSFGADVASTVDHDALSGWFLVAAPLAGPADRRVTATSPKPKVLVVPEHDQFRSPESARKMTAGWPATTVRVVPGADHFLAGRRAEVCRLLEDFARSV